MGNEEQQRKACEKLVQTSRLPRRAARRVKPRTNPPIHVVQDHHPGKVWRAQLADRPNMAPVLAPALDFPGLPSRKHQLDRLPLARHRPPDPVEPLLSMPPTLEARPRPKWIVLTVDHQSTLFER